MTEAAAPAVTAPPITETAPATPAPETPPAAPASVPADVSRSARALAAYRAAVAARTGGKEPAPAEPAAPAAEAAPAPAKEPEAAPAPAAGDDLEKARQQREYLRYQREAVEAKKAREAVEAKLKELEVFTGSDAKAIHAALKAKGIKLVDLANAELAEPEPAKPAETPEAAELRKLQERLDAMEREKTQAEASKVFEQNVGFVTELLTKEADKYPALAGFKRAPAEIVKRFDAKVAELGRAPDDILGLVNEIASEFNRAVYDDVDNILSSDAALKAYLARPEIKTRALALLGAKQSAGPASSEGENGGGKGAPTAIPSTAAASSGARQTRPMTREEKLAAALGNLKRGA